MGGVDNNGMSFGKNQKINFQNFNGIQKSDFANTCDTTLTNSLFEKYDKNKDNILDEGELQALESDVNSFAKNDKLSKREAKKFYSSLGLEKGHDLKREDLYNFLQTIQADKDSVSKAVTSTGESGVNVTVVEFKPDENNIVKRVAYSNESDGTRKPVMEQAQGEGFTKTFTYNHDGTVLYDEVSEGKRIRLQYDESRKPMVMVEEDGNVATTSKFGEDGKTVTTKYRQTGTVTEILDPENGDRVKTRVTDKGNGVTEAVNFTYNEDGSITETLVDSENRPVSTVTKKDGKELAKSTVTVAEDGSTTEITTSGEGDNIQRVRVQKDKEGNVTGKVNVDENGNPVAYKHKVNDGENWYGIVEAKYGVSGYKTVMEIVHQLKKNAGVSRNSTRMPSEIELPPTIQLKNGKTVSLKNIDTQFDEINSAAARYDVSKIKVPKDLPSAYPQDKLPAKKVTVPNEYLEVKPENAGKKITQSDGKVFEYDNKGRVGCVYNSEADSKADENNAIWLEYDDSGNFSEYQLNDYDTNGHFVGAKVYGKDGKLSYFVVNEGINPETGQYARQIRYSPDGTAEYLFENYVYDDKDRCVSYDRFDNNNGRFKLGTHFELKYSSDGKHTRTLWYGNNGKLKQDDFS